MAATFFNPAVVAGDSHLPMKRLQIVRSLGFLATLALSACGAKVSTIPGSRIPDNALNRQIIDTVEQYRLAVERKDAAALLLMASKSYWEDGGTPTGSDDYGYDGLRQVLQSRFQQASDIRYSLRYVNIYRRCKGESDPGSNDGCRAYVDVLIDASYSVTDALGQSKRPDMRDQNQLVLEWAGDKWLFLSGM